MDNSGVIEADCQMCHLAEYNYKERNNHLAKWNFKNVNLVVIDELEEILQYHTWILPTLVINEKLVARGYVPDIKIIQEYLKQIG